MLTAVIFGGTGFIGTHFAKHLIDDEAYEKVYLFDQEEISAKSSKYRKNLILKYPQISIIYGDVTNKIEFYPDEKITLVANFAAVHREPGHEAYEYFQCNILGAENVCAWSEKIGCEKIIFSSSIAPYGPSELEMDEGSMPVPTTAYGSSKLVAEKIHEKWHSKDGLNRQLVIVRPGVVFGPGEGGNVTRLISAVRKRYFFYTGNKNTRKAGVYIKELCYAMSWVLNINKSKKNVVLFNMSMDPSPSIEEYVNAIAKVLNMRILIPSIHEKILLISAYLISATLGIIRISHPFSPIRIKKLNKSNNILPTYLIENNYKYKYSLEEAFIDWKNECPQEWK